MCKRKNIVPNFIKIKPAVENNRSCASVKKAEKIWLKLEIKHKYKELAECELETYALHLEITRNMSNFEFDEWLIFDQKVLNQKASIVKLKKLTHEKKLNNLCAKIRVVERKMPKFIPEFVINESSAVLDENELDLLNKSLKFAPKPTKDPIVDTIVDVETILKYKLPSVQNDIRPKNRRRDNKNQ